MDAERWLRDELQKQDRGLWVDPSAGAVRFGEYAEEWFRGLMLKPKTTAGYRSLLDSRILPTLGTVELRRISPDFLRAWVAAMAADGLSASRMGQAKRVVSAVLAQAVNDGLIGRNPAETVKVPKTRERDQRYLTAEQVTELAHAVEQRMRGGAPLVKLLAYGGLRWGEAVALRSNNVDVLRRRVHVRESATLVNGKLIWGTPKSHRSRTIVIPTFLINEMAPVLSSNHLVFTSSTGQPLRSPNFLRRVWRPAVAECALGNLVPHDLRHTAASLAISAGASVKAVQRMLGHSSAQITLDRYTHLFEDDLESLAESMDARYGAAQVRPKRTLEDVADLTGKTRKIDIPRVS
ncbi:MAG: site-specific integrase [Acidimicrobiia bacterium]|nr:site-specific integrase [Acidimicrobiia bacterium]